MRIPRPEYNALWNAVSRCHNEKDDQYSEYGGRGIRVCDEWRQDTGKFLSHIGPRPSSKHSLDRIDNDGNYEPGNVKWSTRSEQIINTRKRKNTKSKYRGVSWDSSVNKWWVEITRNKTTYRLGRFDCEEEAGKAYQNKKLELDGL